MKYKRNIIRILFIILLLTLILPSYGLTTEPDPGTVTRLDQNEIGNDTQTLIQLEKDQEKQKENQIIVQYKKRNPEHKIKNQSLQEKIEKVKKLNADTDAIKINENEDVDSFIQEIKKDDGVLYAEKNFKIVLQHIPNDPGYPDQWGLQNIMAPQAWDNISGLSKSVVVAVIDSGIDPDHNELINRIAPGGYNFISDNTDVYDINGHGTMVSGVIAAQTDNGEGVAGVAGDFDVKVLPLQTADNDGYSYLSDVIQAIDYAITQDVDVINLSMGSSQYSDTENAAIQRAVQAGITVAASAGNDGSSDYCYPASCDNVISAGSINRSNQLSYFSNYNDKIDVTAPGENILTTGIDNSYYYASGTSFSSPMTAGVAAILKGIDPSLTPSEITTIICNSAVDLGDPGFDNDFGYGAVDFNAAVQSIISSSIPVTAVSLNKTSLILKVPQPLTITSTSVLTQEAKTYNSSMAEGTPVSETLIATVIPDTATDKTTSWRSSAPEIASVTDSGLVTALNPGTTTITVTTNDGAYEASCAVTVLPATPVIVGSNDGSGTIDVSGAAAGAVLKLYNNLNQIIDTQNADESGCYQFKLTEFGNGYYVTQTVNGIESDVSDPVEVIQPDHCFIATAAFGSKFAWPVALLRHFRDQYLLTNSWGAAFVRFYYRHSPPIAALIAGSGLLRLVVRIMLAPVIMMVYILYHSWILLASAGLLLITLICCRSTAKMTTIK